MLKIFYLLLETLEIISIFSFIRFYFKSVFVKLESSIFYISKNIFNFLSKTLNSDKDCELFLLEVLFNWLCLLFISLSFSFIIFINEELETSILEIFFETFFLTWVLLYIPDIFLYNFNNFSNKLHFLRFDFINFILPYIEIFSQFIKSFTLSIRLNVNFISGHLLFTFIVILFEFLYNLLFKSSLFLFFLFIFVYSMEVFISVLQIYVIFLLTTLYIHESKI